MCQRQHDQWAPRRRSSFSWGPLWAALIIVAVVAGAFAFSQILNYERAPIAAASTPQQTIPEPQELPDKCVVNQNANLRSGPGTNYKVVAGTHVDSQFDIYAVSNDGKWYQIDEGRWIAAFLCDLEIANPEPVPTLASTPVFLGESGDSLTDDAEILTDDAELTDDAQPMVCTTARRSNLRSGPTKTSRQMGTVQAGDSLEIVAVSEDGLWLQTTESYWIVKNQCESFSGDVTGRSYGSIGGSTPMTDTIGIRRSGVYTTAEYPFSYIPGGNAIGQTADDIQTCPAGLSGCFRWWQAANKENIPWTVGFAEYASTGPIMALDHPTLWRIAGVGSLKFKIYLDYDEPTAYDVANVKKSPLGLGLFFAGNGATVCVDEQCLELDGLGTLQAPLTKGWKGFYNIEIHVHDTMAQVNMNVGEKLTTKDNWTPTQAR